MTPIDYFYLEQTEPVKSCLIALKEIIMAQDNEITAVWKYKVPFFCYKNKMFCYLWIHKKHKQAYIGFVDGNKIEHPNLIKEKRARMKILLVNPDEDLQIATIHLILQQAIDLCKLGNVKL